MYVSAFSFLKWHNLLLYNRNYADAYLNRGISKWYLKLPYCSDFKKACDLGLCDNYNDLCK